MPALVPANAKKGLLIFNMYKLTDFLLIVVSAIITIIIYFMVDKSFASILLAMSPLVLAILYTIPIPNYQNLNKVLRNLSQYTRNDQKYYWKGWCLDETFKDE